jgi:hypothetical protein
MFAMQRTPLSILTMTLAAWFLAAVARAEDSLDFNRDVRPILADACFSCHGFDNNTREADLRLDTFAGATSRRGKEPPAIVPGASKQSPLVARITAEDESERMPPPESGKSLTTAQIDTLTTWIDAGAEYAAHWSFVSPQRPAPPATNSDWPLNPIDQFILRRLSAEGLSPAEPSDRETLVRRVSYDVTGLPPTLAEIDAFLADQRPGAYERMVARYLDSPHYGEQMARWWLDLSRYADTNGYQYDRERQQWVWRDWVIWALNENMPFDQFTIKQLAGDLLPGATPLDRLATGFNRNHPITIEGGVIDEEYRTEYVVDRLNTTSNVWLGLSMGCARCHDHKYDPISQREFYELFAFFNQVPERGLNGFDPREKIASPLADGAAERIDGEIARLRKALAALPDDADARQAAWEEQITSQQAVGWTVVEPTAAKSSGGSTLTPQDDHSLLAGGANPAKDTYTITAETQRTGITAVRLEALTHASLPGGGPGRYPNSNFVLTDFVLEAISLADPKQSQLVRFVKVIADYEQKGYPAGSTIDNNRSSGWAVDGPTHKKDCAAVFVAEEAFGFEGGTELRFTLRHESPHAQHNVGRPRLAITSDAQPSLDGGLPEEVRGIIATPRNKRTLPQRTALQKYFAEFHPSPLARPLLAQIARLEQEKTSLAATAPATLIMRELPAPRKTHVLYRGEYDKPRDPVQPGVPAILPKLRGEGPANRLALARWLVDPQHPLTARVAVNRLWQQVFGVGLVKTAEDFGVQGEWPSHPELFDWLATEYVRTGWDTKAMLQLMLTSAAYRQSSRITPQALARDPENRLLARGPRFRLAAEEIRDTALAASGLLNRRVGGPSVYPYHPQGLWLEINNRPGYSRAYPHTTDPAHLYRRSMYTFWKRTVPPPSLATFDAPEREYCVVRRSRTNTPLQAFVLMHDPQYVEAARALGARILRETGATDPAARVVHGFRLATGRLPSEREASILVNVHQARLAHYKSHPEEARKLLTVGASPRDENLDLAQHAAWTTVARLLLNLSETITKS